MENSKASKEEEKTSPYQELYGKTQGKDVAGTPDGEEARDQPGAFGSAATPPGPESKDSDSDTASSDEDGHAKD